MKRMYYIGLDVHKRKISYCVKESSGRIHSEGWIPATRYDLDWAGAGPAFDEGIVTKILRDNYVFIDDDRGGFHWVCFKFVPLPR